MACNLYNKLNKISFEYILLIMFLVSIYFDMTDSGIYYHRIILIGVSFIIYIIKNKNMCLNQNLYLYFLFCIMVCFSGVYAYDNSTAFGNIVVVITNLMLMIIIPNVIYSKRHIRLYITLFIILAIILSIRVISITDFQRMLQGRYYPDVTLQQNIGNRNVIAIILGISLNFTLYKIYNYKSVKYAIPMAIIFIAILLTGSRKGLLISIIPMGLFFLFKFIEYKSIVNKIKIVFLGVLMTILVFNVIMKVDIMYDLIGFRLESMYKAYIYGEESSESSFNIRQDMINKGIEYFKKRPLMGYGVSNYRYLYKQDMGKETYSHNNFIELLVNNGIIGFLIYYIFYINVILSTNYRRLKAMYIEESNYYLMMMCMLICMLILDTGAVSYNLYTTYLLLGLSMKRLDDEI